MKKLFNYLRPAIEGDDGRLSLRRLIAIAFAVGFVREVNRMPPTVENLYIISGTMLTLLGLTTLQALLPKPPSDKPPGS